MPLDQSIISSSIWLYFYEYLHVLFHHACSVGKVTREPQLSEWTERASKCDIENSGWFVDHFNCCFQYRIASIYNNQCLILWHENPFQVRIAMVGKYTGCFQYRIDFLSLYITTSAWYYGMKIIFRLGLLWLESILAYQIPTYLL